MCSAPTPRVRGPKISSRADLNGFLACKPQHLATLVAVAKAKSFRLAGEQLGYVQSAVSRQIESLEHEAGTRLVERRRGTNEVNLTAAGELLLRHAEALLSRLTAARADLASLAEGETAGVEVGVVQGIGQRLLWTALAAHKRLTPRAHVLASEFSTDGPLFELVSGGALDMGIARLPLARGPFDHCPLLRMRWVLAVPAKWTLPEEEEGAVHPAGLTGRPLICGHNGRAGPGGSLEDHLRSAGAEPNVVFRTEIDQTVRSLVAAGVGAALTPAYVPDLDDEQVRLLQLKGVPMTQVVALFWHRKRQLSPAAERFRSTALAVCNGIQRDDQRATASPA